MTLKRSLGLLALVVVAGLLGWWWLSGAGETARAADPAPPPEVPVKTAQVKVQDVPVLLNGLGTVQALNVVEIKAQVNGTLIALPAREGQELPPPDRFFLWLVGNTPRSPAVCVPLYRGA